MPSTRRKLVHVTDVDHPREWMKHLGFGLTFLVIAVIQVGAALMAARVIDPVAVGVPLAIIGLLVAFGASYLIVIEPEGGSGRRAAQAKVFRWCFGAALVVSLLMILLAAVVGSPVPFVIGAIMTVIAYIVFVILVRMAK